MKVLLISISVNLSVATPFAFNVNLIEPGLRSACVALSSTHVLFTVNETSSSGTANVFVIDTVVNPLASFVTTGSEA